MPSDTADPRMAAQERTQVLDWLDRSHQEFLASIDGVSEEQWRWAPEPECWPVGGIAEHVVLSEALLFGAVQKALASPPNPAWHAQTSGKTELIERVMAPRLGKATAPKSIEPRHGMSPARVKQAFEQQRAGIVEFVTGTDRALKEHTLEHPMPVFGTLNAYQWLIYVPLHTMRHYGQIALVRASDRYPR